MVRTSWTPRHPGRRFLSCPDVGLNCRFIDWVDPPMCQRSTLIIPGLLRNINNLQAQLSIFHHLNILTSRLLSVLGWSANLWMMIWRKDGGWNGTCWELKGFYKFILLEGLSAAIED
ncbi:hypothetical protein Tco_1089165 [Tanacetum coccineum]